MSETPAPDPSPSPSPIKPPPALARYWKLIVFIIGAALTVALQVWGPDNGWVSLGVLIATALGIYQVPNKE